MTNIIEITVRGTNELPATLAEAKAQARAQGQQIGDELTKGVSDKVKSDIPPVVDDSFQKTKEPARKSGSDAGAAFTQALGQELSGKISSISAGNGALAGSAFSANFAEKVKVDMTSGNLMSALGPQGVEALAKAEGDRSGFNFTDAFGGRVRDSLPAEVEKPLEDSGKKGGAKAGNAAAGAMSPLLLGAFAAAATAGPGLILGATATAVLGAGALITKGNADLQASYQQLGRDASDAIETATAPLIPALQGAVTVLDQGIGKTGSELEAVFSAAAPMAADMASGILSLVDNALPGMETGLKAIAPYSAQIAADFGKLGSGIGGLFSGLAGGAGGGMAGFSALIDLASHLLTDIGQITGSLANGLGPALHDVDTVAVPVAGALSDVVAALPPGAVRAAADAVAVLFAAFQIGKLTGAVAEGQSFLQFLGVAKTQAKATATEVAALGVTEEAAAAKTGMMASAGALGGKAIGGLGAAASVALGPIGLITAGAGLLGDKLGKLAGVGATIGPSIESLASTMQDAANGSGAAQDGITQFATALASAPFNLGAASIQNLDAALVKLQSSDPQQAATEFYQIQQALEAQGKSAAQVTALFPQYTKALQDAKISADGLAAAAVPLSGSVDVLTQKLTAANLSTQDSARQSAAATLAALGFSDGEGTLATSLDASLQAFTLNSGAASALGQAYDALFGKFASYSDAQAKFTIDLANVAKQVAAGKDATDLSTEAGSKNFEVFKQLADVNESRAQALLAETGSQDKANTSLYQGALALDAAARKAGLTKGQIDQLNLSLYGTTKLSDLKITIGADTSQAYGAVRQMVEYFDHQAAYVQVYASPGGNPGGHQLLAHGGVVGSVGAAAVGGVHGSLTMINEQGPELVRLPGGSTVFTNPDTQRMLQQAFAGAGGGKAGGAVQLEWVGGNAGDEFLVWLRKHIRGVGGTGLDSVQLALGQNR